MNLVAESGRNPVSKHRILSLIVENERANAREDGRIRLPGPNSQARMGGERGKINFPVQLTTSSVVIGNSTRSTHVLLIVVTILLVCPFFRSFGFYDFFRTTVVQFFFLLLATRIVLFLLQKFERI